MDADEKGWRMEERKAIERLKRGDIGALEALVRRHQVGAIQAAYLVVRDPALAEDVAQGAFLRVYEKIGLFDGRRPFGPWFTKMVVNHAAETARRRERTVSFEAEDVEELLARLVDPEASPHELAEKEEMRRRVREALEELPRAQRTAVVQRYYLGMSEAEMAEGGAAAPGTIKWRLHAARESLLRILGPWFRAEEARVSRRVIREQPAPIVGVSLDPKGRNLEGRQRP